MSGRHQIWPQFFERAVEMRARFAEHFARPVERTVDTHGVWNYWYVPGRYTLMRAAPERIFGALAAELSQRLAGWSVEHLGLTGVGPATVTLYLNGCSQTLHSDSHTGIWGYVFSLTPDGPRFAGGETLLFKDGSPNHRRHHVESEVLYDLIPPRFNQLLIFDDRVAHAVTPLQGTMDPLEGRLVLVGHIHGGVTIVEGALAADAVEAALATARRQLALLAAQARDVHGMLVARLMVGGGGSVSSAELLFNNLISPRGDTRALGEMIVEQLTRVAFPSGPGRVTVPLLLPFVDNPPITIERRHSLSREAARGRVAELFSHVGIRALVAGHWLDEQRFSITQPAAGSLELDERHLRLTLAAPVTPPSLWMRLGQTLAAEVERLFPS